MTDKTYQESAIGTSYHKDTPQIVCRVLDAAIKSGQRLRVYYGDKETGKSWGEEFDTIGRVSRSMGPVKIPILVKTSRSLGGGGILDHCIIGIQSSPQCWLYRHPNLNLGQWTWEEENSSEYTAVAYCDGELRARFKSAKAASRYCAFMEGKRFAK